MKIFVIQPYARTPGHYDRETQRSCEAFTRLGSDVTLVTYSGIHTGARKGPPPNFNVVSAVTDGNRSNGDEYRTRKIYLNGLRAYLRWQLRDLRTSLKAASLIRHEKPTVAHFFDPDAILLTLVIGLLLRRRRPLLLMTIHQIDRPLSPAKRVLGKVNRFVYRRCLKRLIQHDLDGVVVFDPSIKQTVVDRLNITPEAARRICVLPHGVGDPIEISSKEDARSRLGLSTRETIFLVFGVLRADKRIDLVIEAMEGLSQCRLLIVGGPQDYTASSIKELVESYGCEGSVSAEVDYVPEPKMHDYFSACDAVIIPYAASFKGQSGILTLACGHGRPVIASDVRTLGEAVEQHKLGFVVEPDSAAGLRDAIRHFLCLGSEERRDLEQRVISYAKLMSWDNTCKQWLEFYQALLDRRANTPELSRVLGAKGRAVETKEESL
jgi:glycosyltransferase involved in cell wall biosynthesis